jgi:hypothetical protein
MDKKLVIGAVVLLLLVSGYFFFTAKPDQRLAQTEKKVENTSEPAGSGHASLQNAEVYDPLTPTDKYTLKNGEGQLQTPDGPPVGFIKLLDKSAEVGDSIMTIVAYNYGGSGVFEYLASFSEEDGTYVMTSDQGLGDRVKVENLRADGDIVTIVYYDFGEGQSMADNPNVRIENKYKFSNGKLTPVK